MSVYREAATERETRLRAYPRRRGHHPVWEDVEVQAHHLEDVFEEADDLEGQHVLPSQAEERMSGHVEDEDEEVEEVSRGEPLTCLQSSPTLKMAACQQILLASSSLLASSRESERHRRPDEEEEEGGDLAFVRAPC